jgi:hypothetical protein
MVAEPPYLKAGCGSPYNTSDEGQLAKVMLATLNHPHNHPPPRAGRDTVWRDVHVRATRWQVAEDEMQLAKAEACRRSLWRGGGGSKPLLFVIADSLSIDYFPHLAEALASEYRVAQLWAGMCRFRQQIWLPSTSLRECNGGMVRDK